MSKEQKNVPKLRFPGFTGEWEQRKLEGYLEVSKKKNKDGVYDKEDVLSVSGDYGIVNQIEFQGRSFAGESVANYGVVETGDVVYTKSPLKSNPYGIIKTNKGQAGIVSTLYAVYKPKFNTCPDFIQVYFELDARMNNYMRPLVNKGAKNDMKVSAENALKGEVCFPRRAEQETISEFFAVFDTLITLQQRKLDQIKEYKKGMLQKMFPKEGETVPEMRFPGFGGEWEQRKLGELAEVKDSARIPNSEWTDSGVPYIRASDLTNDDTSGVLFISSERYDYYRSKTGAPAQGDVLFNGGGEIGKALLHSNNKPIYVQGGAVLYARTSVSESLDGQFLKTYFETPNAKSYIDIASAGGTMKHFTLKPSLEMPIQFPNIPEQLQLGSFFKSLDTLITLHQRKLEAMKEYKKGLLQKMFV